LHQRDGRHRGRRRSRLRAEPGLVIGDAARRRWGDAARRSSAHGLSQAAGGHWLLARDAHTLSPVAQPGA
jgi:hypothetical protein